jgi:hypothetical protein
MKAITETSARNRADVTSVEHAHKHMRNSQASKKYSRPHATDERRETGGEYTWTTVSTRLKLNKQIGYYHVQIKRIPNLSMHSLVLNYVQRKN